MSTTTQLVTITLDGKQMQVAAGTTIMEAAEQSGVRIPRLCYHPDLSLAGSCRVCIVQVEEMPHYMASCSVNVWEGMEIRTNSPQIRQARRDMVELLLDNHNMDCQTCERDSNCELQNLAYTMGVRERLYAGKRKDVEGDTTSVSVIRDPSRCILCGRCVRVCAEIQGVHNLQRQGRGFNTAVTPAHGVSMDESVCIQCGQCINVCPTAAFLERSKTEEVWAALADPTKHVVVQTAPSIRAAIAEGFGYPPGTPSTQKMVRALRYLGFEAVFDTNFGADLTIVEEANEFLQRLQGNGPLPMLTSCSPGWISFMEKFYPALIPHASTCRSPMSMLSALTKTYYAEQQGIDPGDIYMVAVMPCVAKKYEAERPEHKMANGAPYTDAVLTTRELTWMIKSWGIDYRALSDEAVDEACFDSPLGESTGAADIFGTTGGVMEATLRTAAEKLTGERQGEIDFQQVRGVEGVKEAALEIAGKTVRIAVANGLKNAKLVLDAVVRGEKELHVIEVMACPGGCIGGGGQPYPPEGFRVLDRELLHQRASALYAIDAEKTLRRSHDNPSIIKLYDEYLGEPGGKKAHELLHTTYSPKLPRGIQ